ncbi:hypothetical protein AOQ84DRAFT_195979 [Glonium stellatum]|uniref:Uncharacterized protein n=1 Tax=Glonium stellatum TaxID=574774 RepID=A0A8E2JMD5_9PEZI|nr:hypothetical protein AOQ84DRAFT_195979 [Glonium stellatum]
MASPPTNSEADETEQLSCHALISSYPTACQNASASAIVTRDVNCERAEPSRAQPTQHHHTGGDAAPYIKIKLPAQERGFFRDIALARALVTHQMFYRLNGTTARKPLVYRRTAFTAAGDLSASHLQSASPPIFPYTDPTLMRLSFHRRV